MNSDWYRKVLKNHLTDIDENIAASDWIFEQGNAPVYRSKVSISRFKSQKVNVLLLPSLAADSNPIENRWEMLARTVYNEGKQFNTKEQLKTAILKSWEVISLD